MAGFAVQPIFFRRLGPDKNQMTTFFHIILTKPLLNALVWFYNIIPGQDLGLAIVALTLLIRIILIPAFQKSLRSQKELQQLQPKLEEIRQKHKDDKQAQTKATLELYKEHKINPFSSCLPLLIQLPILIALYQVFLSGLNSKISGELYSFISDPGTINTNFLGVIELARANLYFGVAAGALQFVQSKMMTPKKNPNVPLDQTARLMNAQLTYFMPVLTAFIAIKLPAGLALYWVVTTLFAIVQQYYIMRKDK